MPLATETLLLFYTASVLLALTPGPDNLFVLAQAAQRGKLAGIAVTLGLCTGVVGHTMAVALGVAALFQTSPFAFNLLKYLGAVYLLYLAWQSFRAGASLEKDGPGETLNYKGLYLRGIIMNATNPKVSIFFLAFLPQFTNPERGPLLPQFLFLGILFILATIPVFGGISLLAARLSRGFRHSEKTQLLLNRAAGAVFLLLAINLALSKI